MWQPSFVNNMRSPDAYVIQGCIGEVSNSQISGFLNLSGIPTGGRTGYGIYVDCNDTSISGNFFSNNKHCVTCASRNYVMSGLNVYGNTVDTIGCNDVQAAFDLHANVFGVPIFSANQIRCARSAFGIRNGGAKIINNYIECDRNSEVSPALVGTDEYQRVYHLDLSSNYFNCSSNIRLVNFGDADKIEGVIISSNRGKIGSLISQVINAKMLSNITISGNNLSKMKRVIDISKATTKTIKPKLSILDAVNIYDNHFDISESIDGEPVIHVWTRADNPVVDKLIVNNFSIRNNIIISSDTPIVFRFVNMVGVNISSNRLTHSISSSEMSFPTQQSLDISNCNLAGFIVSNNKFDGRVRIYNAISQNNTSISYPDEKIDLDFTFYNNVAAAIYFSELRDSIDSSMIFKSGDIAGNFLKNPYGTTIGFTTAIKNMGWDDVDSGVVDIRNNRLNPSGGYGISITSGYINNKISYRDNLMTNRVNNLSGFVYLDSNNHIIMSK